MKPKQNPPTPSRFKAGFTLTELLVVILIIVTLAAVSFTGIQRIRQSAQLARCADNLRTWGIAINSHAADNSGQVVWNGWASISSSARYYETYLGGDGVTASAMMEGNNVLTTQLYRRCPSQKWDGTGNGPVGYAMTRPNPKVANAINFNLTTANDPSQLLLMIDAQGFLNINGANDIITAITPISGGTGSRHRQSINALFGDGHVSSYKFGDIAGADSRKTAMRERWLTLR